MTAKENLLRLIEQLPADRLEKLERVVISMLEEAGSSDAPAPGAPMSYEDAKNYAFTNFDETLHRLAQ